MALNAREKSPNRSPVVISLQVSDQFYAALQGQIEKYISSMSAEQILAVVTLFATLSLLQRVSGQEETPKEQPASEGNLLWNFLSQIQTELPKDQDLRELLREANIQLVVNDQPVELPSAPKTEGELDDPFESFKRGWDDAMHGRTISREEFRRRMLEDGD